MAMPGKGDVSMGGLQYKVQAQYTRRRQWAGNFCIDSLEYMVLGRGVKPEEHFVSTATGIFPCKTKAETEYDRLVKG